MYIAKLWVCSSVVTILSTYFNNMPQRFLSIDWLDATMPDSFDSDEDWKCAIACKYWEEATKIIDAMNKLTQANNDPTRLWEVDRHDIWNKQQV